MQAESQKQKRAIIACTACRQSKIKCSGDEPCSNCQRRSLSCQFLEANDKVLVSERYLRELQKQAQNWQHASGTGRPRQSAFPLRDGDEGVVNDAWTASDISGPNGESPASQTGDLMCNIWASPFTLPSIVFKDTRTEQRNWIWLAPSSAWSLTARLIVLMTEKLDVGPGIATPKFYLDGDLYPLSWNSLPVTNAPDMSCLPSIDYVLYLFNIVKFRIGPRYRFLDEAAFISHLQEFYSNRGCENAIGSRFWFVQFLLVLSLGNAFVARPRTQSGPPGSKFFTRAMSVMPNYTSTGKDSLTAMEALALVGIYLYAIDHREAAHVHVGHAIRIAHLEGLHTRLPEEELGSATVARCRNIWWSLYIMDRHVSSSLGLPMTTQDSDISTPINTPNMTPQDIIFSLEVGLSRMLSYIINTIYKTEKTRLGTFLEITKDILQTMARHAEEIKKMVHVDFQGSMDNAPQETRHIILLYHQCVIIATRPLLLSVLKERLEKLGRAEEDWQKFLALPKSLISIGIKSAVKTLQILSDENSLLEIFLPSDLEFTYAAALHLTMANTLFPCGRDDQTCSQAAHSVLDEMISTGNKVAEARKGELIRIEGLFQKLADRVEQEGLQVLSLSNRGVSEVGRVNNGSQGELEGQGPVTETETDSQSSTRDTSHLFAEESVPASVDVLDQFGISPYEFISIANQIDHPEVSYGIFDTGLAWIEGRHITDSFV